MKSIFPLENEVTRTNIVLNCNSSYLEGSKIKIWQFWDPEMHQNLSIGFSKLTKTKNWTILKRTHQIWMITVPIPFNSIRGTHVNILDFCKRTYFEYGVFG